ncbi:stress response protein SCP2 [Rhodococcus sp. SMB37]|uniref:TerD family protein n=1 Tax=Rhodococcus sp. SMB37 TaxID=2512213 RepID=UPI00104F866B|nr:TerD family protein [Rhodococcus sp. SMB37]TCN45128.1 stress response protein SCP2 [Rhodococcus sp. SMB37]
MNGVFSAGQNAPLTARTVRFTVSAAVPVDLCAFVVDDRLQVASSDDVVFYNQPRTQGVRLDGNAIVVEVDALRAGARVLCAAGTASPVAVSTTLTDPSGTSLATFEMDPSGAETALLCWELYPHNGNWKLRALGQGYAAGLGEMFIAHGIEVDDGPAPVEQPSQPEPQPSAVPSGVTPSFEWLWKIFEDAARSAAAYVSAHEYAQHRLDDELSAAVADPATRTGAAAEAARALAHRRCAELNAAAEQRHHEDTARLTDELRAIDAALHASLASWASPAWNTLRTQSDGIRVGELSAPERGSLQVPLCVPLPMRRPLWIDGDDSATQQVVTALALRLLAAQPGARIDIVDTAGALLELRALTAPVLAGPPVLDIGGVASKLKGLADSADLATLAMSTDPAAAHVEPRVLVLAGVPHGYSSDDLMQVIRLTQLPGAQHISIVIAGAADTVVEDPAYQILLEQSQHLPSSADGHFADPWTGSDWTFTPDVVPVDAVLLQRVITTLGAV